MNWYDRFVLFALSVPFVFLFIICLVAKWFGFMGME